MLLVHPDGPASRATNAELNISFEPTPDYPGIAKAASNGELFAARVRTEVELQDAIKGAVEAMTEGNSAVLDVAI